MAKKPLREQVLVVTGASSGLGRAIAYVANAIVTVYAEVERLEPDELRRFWEVNFFGVVYGYWAALPHLRASRGTFLHVSADLPARAVRPRDAALCRAPDPGAADLLGRPEAALGPEALAARGGLDAPLDGLEEPALPNPVDAPDNLFDTLLEDPGAHGRFDDWSRGSTVWTWLRLLVPKS